MYEDGKKLKETREEKELSVTELSKKLKMSVSRIKDLEEGNFNNFPDPFYAERFLKTYADFLGVEVDPIVKKEKEETLPAEDIKTAGVNIKRYILIVLLVAAAGLIIFFSLKYMPDIKNVLSGTVGGAEIAQGKDSLKPLKIVVKAVPSSPTWMKVASSDNETYFSGMVTSEKIWEAASDLDIRIGNIYGVKLYMKKGGKQFKEIDLSEGSRQGVNDIVITNEFSK